MGHLSVLTTSDLLTFHSPFILNNCLFILSLSHKLLSINQLTKELDCTVLITSINCIVQDTQTGKIIGHGNEKEGL